MFGHHVRAQCKIRRTFYDFSQVISDDWLLFPALNCSFFMFLWVCFPHMTFLIVYSITQHHLCIISDNLCIISDILCIILDNLCIISDNLCIISDHLCIISDNLCFISGNLCIISDHSSNRLKTNLSSRYQLYINTADSITNNHDYIKMLIISFLSNFSHW